MHRLFAISFLSISLLVSFSAWATTDAAADQKPVSAEFQKVRALAGTWTGMAIESNGVERPATVEYLVTAGGSTVVETLFPGTEHAMVSVYHQRNGQLAMAHYCMLGNRPNLMITSAKDNAIELSLASDGGIDAANETHMHALKLDWADADHLKETWTLYEHGKPAGSTTIALARQR